MRDAATAREVRVTPAIGKLQQSVQALTDGDHVLPVDGHSLHATLDAALAGLTAADKPAARAAMEEFVMRAQALMEAGCLGPDDAHLLIDTAAGILASLRG